MSWVLQYTVTNALLQSFEILVKETLILEQHLERERERERSMKIEARVDNNYIQVLM